MDGHARRGFWTYGSRNATSNPGHYYGLDLLRILAAYLVVFNHFGQYNFHYDPAAHGTVAGAPLAFPILSAFSGVGSVGVEIFFVISGFVITESVQNATPLQFLRRRMVRVLPALWICASISLIARGLSGEPIIYLVFCWARSLVLSPIGPYIDGVVWTLVVEAAFYAAVFVAMLFSRNRSLRILETLICVVSVPFVLLLGLAKYNGLAAAQLLSVLDRFPFKLFLFQHGVFFALGMAFWRWHREERSNARLLSMLPLALLGCMEIVAASRNSVIATSITVFIWLAGMAILFGSVRFRDVVITATRSWHGTILDLGRLSYTLYLGHYAIGMIFVSMILETDVGRGPGFAFTLVGISALAWFVMAIPERRLQYMLKSAVEGSSVWMHRLHNAKRRVGALK